MENESDRGSGDSSEMGSVTEGETNSGPISMPFSPRLEDQSEEQQL